MLISLSRFCVPVVFEPGDSVVAVGSEVAVVENRPNTREVRLMAIWPTAVPRLSRDKEVGGGCRLESNRATPA